MNGFVYDDYTDQYVSQETHDRMIKERLPPFDCGNVKRDHAKSYEFFSNAAFEIHETAGKVTMVHHNILSTCHLCKTQHQTSLFDDAKSFTSQLCLSCDYHFCKDKCYEKHVKQK